VAKRETFTLEWDAHEYEHKERSRDWFWAVGIVAAAGAITSIIFGNYIFAVLLLLCAFSLTLHINRPPETIHVVVSERGIERGRTLYPYQTLHSFWVDEIHPHKKIILKSKKLLVPLIVVPLGEADGERVRTALLRALPEEPLRLPLLESILEYFGF
jgi:hypothetical protein